MKESDKGLVAVAVFIAIFYLSKKDDLGRPGGLVKGEAFGPTRWSGVGPAPMTR